ncbi:sensor domain-containing diguanylate cyclase [Ensifer soli]|uniref:sensor domain-containing diguanylate cyclase n=1 Tax=Ciceribacter sp. sgz301302 TaxID=3342379 RepID=UPI0035B7BA5E
MKISAITNWAYGITVALTLISGGAFLLSVEGAEGERVAVEKRLVLEELAEDLALGMEERSDEARLYVMRGEARHLDAFHGRENEQQTREARIEAMKAHDLPAAEVAILERIGIDSLALDALERAAIDAYAAGDVEGARRTLFGPEHERLQSDLLEKAAQFRTLVTARADGALGQAKLRADLYGTLAKIMLALTAAVFLGVLYFIVKRRIARPLVEMTSIVNRMAKQDYAIEMPVDRRQDEIGEMSEAINVFRLNGLERERLDAERRLDQQMKDMILQMLHRMQACQSRVELAEVVARFVPQIFPGLAGRLYVLDDARAELVTLGLWSTPRHSLSAFAADCCWGLRRGRPHVSNRDSSDVSCQHLTEGDMPGLCVPLTAQGEMIGLLYFEERASHASAAETARLYLEIIAENIGLALANLQMRDRLSALASHDPLTGLLNRRALEEALRRLGHGGGDALACLMIDIDRFKRFNDEFGHEAGDRVMQHVARRIEDSLGAAGRAYRFGGEEFAVLLHGDDARLAVECGETIRRAIGDVPLSHNGQTLGPVTVSIGAAEGLASEPATGLLARADGALLMAKSSGRNRVVVAPVTGHAPPAAGSPSTHEAAPLHGL